MVPYQPFLGGGCFRQTVCEKVAFEVTLGFNDAMYWREDPDAVLELINEIEAGDRVRLVVDGGVEGDSEELVVRGDDILVEDTADVIESDDKALLKPSRGDRFQ